MENKFYYYFVLATTGDHDNYNVNYAHAENFLLLTNKKLSLSPHDEEIYGEIIEQTCDTLYTDYEVKNLTKHEFEVMSRHFRVVVNELGQ
tara:strand:- start:108 stop:377 length:270 start_codon:yes stop_codon:yes gene_type:complete